MILDVKNGENGQRIVTIRCALCGGRQGEAFVRFSDHVFNEHSFDDLAIDAPLLADGWRRDEEVVEG